jgi:hypothetical protein
LTAPGSDSPAATRAAGDDAPASRTLLSDGAAAQLVRFAIASACALVVKVVLTWIFGRFLPGYASYLLTHVVLFFWSYYTQARFTFRVTLSRTRMAEYLKAVLLMKLLDYAIFNVMLAAVSGRLSLSVTIASLATSLIRFTQVRRALRKGPMESAG